MGVKNLRFRNECERYNLNPVPIALIKCAKRGEKRLTVRTKAPDCAAGGGLPATAAFHTTL